MLDGLNAERTDERCLTDPRLTSHQDQCSAAGQRVPEVAGEQVLFVRTADNDDGARLNCPRHGILA